MSLSFDHQLLALEPRDLKVYEALLQQREAASIRTVAELTGLNRGTTYEVIKKLQSYGLLSSHLKNKRKYYAAEAPEKLQAYAVERQLAMGREVPKVEGYVTALKQLQPVSQAAQFTKYYDGEEEVATLLQDVLTTVVALEDKTYHVFSSAEVRNHLYAKFRNFTRRRVQMGINVQVIGVGKVGRKANLAKRKLLSTRERPAAYVIIYGNKVAQITLPETGYIRGVVVEDTAIATLQRLVFKKIWGPFPIDD
jgi:sugar-specific transcriptional regulator TrmB